MPSQESERHAVDRGHVGPPGPHRGQARFVRPGFVNGPEEPAAAVQRPFERVDHDPNTAAWGLWPTVTHPAIGKQRVDGIPMHLSETDASIRRGGPCLGEHNDEVFGDLLGLDAASREKLRAEGAI